jgi:uncharacterized membrane protein
MSMHSRLVTVVSAAAPRIGAFVFAALLAGLTGCASSAPKQQAEMVSSAPGSNVPTAPNVDRSKCTEAGKQVVTGDTNMDKKPDVWKYFVSKNVGGNTVQVLVCKQVDLNHDGKLDLVTYYDDTGNTIEMEEADLDLDGKFDTVYYYANGKKVREENDMNFDSRPDVWKYFEDEKLVRIERDTNNDGKVDEWQYYEGGKLDRIGYDSTGSGKVDHWDRAPEGEEETGGGGAAAPAAATPAAPTAAKPTAPPATAPPPATTPPPAAAAGAAKPAAPPAKK